MDQFAVLFGKKNHLLKLDCASLTYEEIPIDMEDYTWMLCNSMVKHNLADSAYNKRKEACDEAVRQLNNKGFDINNLRDVQEKHLSYLTGIIQLRVKHVLEENERVHAISEALQAKDFKLAGQLLTEGHVSLQQQYEVTCTETDFIVNQLNKTTGVLGARQMGGGFGGCVLVLLFKKQNTSCKTYTI